MSFLVVANFKSNLTQVEVKSWLEKIDHKDDMVVAPSFPHLPLFSNLESRISLCAQDVSPFPKGSYTGAVNATQLKELGVTYCIVGHSERRRYFHETPTDIANKVKELLSVGITPLICMDKSDVAPQFAALDNDYLDKCLYCYEPSDGLGGTTTATPEEINLVRKNIENFVQNSQFMYGGSVNADNTASLLSLNLHGVLIATASLDPMSYLELFEVSHAA